MLSAEVLKVMGEMWKRVSPTEKEKYTARARHRFEEHARAVEQWKASVTNDEKAGRASWGYKEIYSSVSLVSW